MSGLHGTFFSKQNSPVPAFSSSITDPPRRAISDLELGRRTLFIVSAILSPIALGLLYNSVGLLQAVGATGTPLGSPGGQLGLLVSAVLIALISHSSRWSTIGPAALTFWAAVFAITIVYETWFSSDIVISEVEALLQWSQLPLVVFFVCLAATLATRYVRRKKGDGEFTQERPKYEGLMITLTALLLAVALLILVYALAPRSAGPLIIRSTREFGSPGLHTALIAFAIALIAFLLTWLATRSVMGVQLAVWAVLLIPCMVLIPLVTTLTGMIATPNNSTAIALAMTMPVGGTIGLIVAVTTHGIALMHKR
ncbi:MAG: hypothetical protein Q4P05_02680 [Actinomycetaceae bacterium]|nr:hypothetical protein [Actinomycetaceae bacterium]